ncbi:hypothetical protein QJS66_10700 [Kocuria rhizophila]|nr:hypothetical protein QJS66_10700 [Kocuria rhizophila]
MPVQLRWAVTTPPLRFAPALSRAARRPAHRHPRPCEDMHPCHNGTLRALSSRAARAPARTANLGVSK